MFQRDATVNNLYGQAKFDDGSVAFDRDEETRKLLAACETFRKEMPPEIGLAVDVHSLPGAATNPAGASKWTRRWRPGTPSPTSTQ
jgi:hypothetical protein